MKYVNSLKYMNSFEAAGAISDVSQKRIRELCLSLGRINIGTSSVFLPAGASGHATAVMLESVIKSAGYKVGRITGVGDYDSRAVVYLDGSIPEIEEYNRAVAELKATVIKNSDENYFKEEISFTLALLLCKMHGCEYIIFEGTSGEDYSLDAVCAPYDLVVIPTVLDGDKRSTRIACDAIKRGSREVISGNQKKGVYDMISNACVTGGIRLNFTSKIGFEVEHMSSIKLSFSYGGRSGYTVKSPSVLQRDCAMLVIESALAIRRDGIKLPWASISSGLSTASGCACFEVVSASPVVIIDSAGNISETAALVSTMDEVFGRGTPGSLSVCIPADAFALLSALEGREIRNVIAVGEAENTKRDNIFSCNSMGDAAKEIVSLMSGGGDAVCFGSVEFALELKQQILKQMGY